MKKDRRRRRVARGAHRATWQEEVHASRAYVSFLHGQRHEFLLYALVLGNRLRRLDPSTPRVLLVGKPLSDYPAPFLEGDEVACLNCFWQVMPVELVSAPEADRTPQKRHRFVFTKLRVLELPFRKVLFFDLDVLLRKDPSELFSVPAPAGMYHGWWTLPHPPVHGRQLPEKILAAGCVNAGLLRLDPLGDACKRHAEVARMIEEVLDIPATEASNLPEQFYLVQRLRGWRHLDVSWNCEVYPSTYVAQEETPDGRWPQHRLRWSELPTAWWDLGNTREELRERVGMFHFSGTQLQPWWYLHLGSERAMRQLDWEFSARDHRGLVGLAVGEWVAAVEELLADVGCMTRAEGEAATVQGLVRWLAYRAEVWWSRACRCPRCRTPALQLLEAPSWEWEGASRSCLEAGSSGGTGGAPDVPSDPESWMQLWEQPVCEDCAVHSGLRAWRDPTVAGADSEASPG